ncbi:MAG: hypothetical protein JW881_11975 [Spirochaetales bacterium]|nr:hypothetical protein [Spirochaetales bacterium]
MKIPVKQILACGLFILLVLPAAAIDYGLTADNIVTISQEAVFSGNYLGKASPWISYESEHVSFALQGVYIYTFEIPLYIDLDYMMLEYRTLFFGDYTGLFSVRGGRFPVSDFTGCVLNHKLDGVRFDFANAGSEISFFAGYAGLLLKPYSTISLSKADISDTGEPDVILAPPRLVGMLQIAFPELFPKHTITASFLGQIDLRTDGLIEEGAGTYDASTGGYLHTVYTGAGLSGGIGPAFFYDIFGYAGTGGMLSFIGDISGIGLYQYKPIFSFLAGLSMRVYFDELLHSRLGVSALYASGDADFSDFYEGNTDGEANQFIPIAHEPVALVFAPQLSNIAVCGLSWSIKPLSAGKGDFMQNFQTQLTAQVFLRPTAGPISEAGLNTDSDAVYLGMEIDATINMRVLSDVGCSISAGCFIPDNTDGGAFEGSRDVEMAARFELSVGL